MANALIGELLPFGALTATTNGEALEISTRSTARIAIETAERTGAVTLDIETSPDGSTWRRVLTTQLNTGSLVRLVNGLSSMIRAVVTVASGATVSLSISAEAHDLYCHPVDVRRFGLPSRALEDASDETLIDVCLAATEVADGFVGAAFKLPLTAWGEDLRINCAKVATRYLLDIRGWDPEGADAPIALGYDNAMSWLNKLAQGKLAPPGIKDSTPLVVDSGAVVMSRPRRERFR